MLVWSITASIGSADVPLPLPLSPTMAVPIPHRMSEVLEMRSTTTVARSQNSGEWRMNPIRFHILIPGEQFSFLTIACGGLHESWSVYISHTDFQIVRALRIVVQSSVAKAFCLRNNREWKAITKVLMRQSIIGVFKALTGNNCEQIKRSEIRKLHPNIRLNVVVAKDVHRIADGHVSQGGPPKPNLKLLSTLVSRGSLK